MFKKLLLISALLLQGFAFSSCEHDEPDTPNHPETPSNPNDKPDSDEKNELEIVVSEDGTTSTGAPFLRLNETEFMLNYIKYHIKDGHLEITGYDKFELGASTDGHILIPASITLDGITYKVRSLKSAAFSDCQALKSITLPNEVIEVNGSAFSNCVNLEKVTLSESLKTISFNQFSGCKSLKSIKLPVNVHTIEREAFLGCSSIETIKLPEQLTSIGCKAFAYCGKLDNITIPDLVEKLDQTFYGCQSLQTVKLGQSVKNIWWAFYDCPKISSFYITCAFYIWDGFNQSYPYGTLYVPSQCYYRFAGSDGFGTIQPYD